MVGNLSKQGGCFFEMKNHPASSTCVLAGQEYGKYKESSAGCVFYRTKTGGFPFRLRIPCPAVILYLKF